MKKQTLYIPQLQTLVKNQIQDDLIVSQDLETGDFYIVNGVMADGPVFYNGRHFGLNSNAWVNKDVHEYRKQNGYSKIEINPVKFDGKYFSIGVVSDYELITDTRFWPK